MSWEVIVGLATVITVGISICVVVANNTKALTQVQCAISTLNTVVEVQAKHLANQDLKLGDHETRIKILELEENK
jgi:cell division protein FtsL